ncbi:MAG TPA: restriction endonuclease subunit S [Planctomycetaceae bacterium]|nr:restriction endonuclease subunit S [Planctomycetaceae bacterium]
MNAETFLKQFGHLADAPNGVQKLRELVLQLAVRGRLAGQRPGDEPVEKLVGQILSHKSAVTGKLSRMAPVETKQLGFDIPESWTVARFGDIVINRDGERVPVSKEIRETRKGPYDYYGASGVIDKIDGFLFDKPLLLIGEDGANLINRSTPIAFIAEGKYWVNNHAHVLDGISREFLNYIALFVNATDLKPYVTGTAQPKMNQAKMNSIPVALPPLAEQHRIVAKVDELLALCDELEAQQARWNVVRTAFAAASLARLTAAPTPAETAGEWSRVAHHFDTLFAVPQTIPQLRQTILQLAVTGRLVEQDEGDEPAEKLLERIDVIRTAPTGSSKTRTLKEPRQVSDTALPFELPAGWCWTRLGSLLLDLRYGTAKKCGYSKNGTPVLRIPNLVDGRISLEDLKYGDLDASERTELGIQSGDILLIRSNGSESLVGRMAVAGSESEGCAFAGYLMRLRTSTKDVDPQFVRFACDTAFVRHQIEAPIRTTSGVKNINSTEVVNLLLPLPPHRLQLKIIGRIAELFAQCDALEVQLTTRQGTAERLTAAMVQGVLEGAGSAAQA